MDPATINRRINIALRSQRGTSDATVFVFDGEQLETFKDGKFKITKLTTAWGPTLFCVTQGGKDMYVNGDERHAKCVAGEWQEWLKAIATSEEA